MTTFTNTNLLHNTVNEHFDHSSSILIPLYTCVLKQTVYALDYTVIIISAFWV